MSRKQIIWTIIITMALAVGITAYRSNTSKCTSTGECPASNQKEEQEKKTSSGTLIWEALSRQLVASVGR